MTRSPRQALLAAVLAIATCALAVPAGASAARGMEVALQDDPVFLQRAYYDRDRALDQARALGVTRLRVSLGWAGALGAAARSTRVPSNPLYDFSRQDDLIDAAAARGIRVQLMLIPPAPAFATGDRKVGPNRPNARRFGQFVQAAAEHFRGRVDRYSMWNEPTHIGWLTPQSQAAGLYRNLYRAGYAAVKRVDPEAEVLIGELVPYKTSRAIAPLRFLRELTCTRKVGTAPARGAPRLARARKCPVLKADGVAHHPYDYLGPPERRYPGADNVTIGTLDRLTGTLDELARLKVLTLPSEAIPPDVFLTEFGYFGTGRNRHPDLRRASYLRRAYTLAQRNPYVRQILQYLLVRPPDGFPGDYFDMSIVTMDGRTSAPYQAISKWSRSAARRGQVAAPGPAIQLPPRP